MKPIFDRKGIPFFHQKTALEFQQDVYERYHEMVLRQAALHLADEIWGKYPFQPVFDFAETHYPKQEVANVLELGCSVGRWIAILAKRYPKATCWGIDYSYQMLKCASDFWVKGNEISIDLTDKGFADLLIKGEKLSNLKFGLAKVGQGHALAQQNRQGHTLAQQNRQRHAITQQNRQGHALALPFDENSQDLIVNSFLIDRVENPKQGLEEMYQILKPNGKLIVVTPLNFQKAEHWQTYFPPIQIKNILTKIGFEILDWQEEIMIDEPLDFRGNSVCWKCLGLVAAKI